LIESELKGEGRDAFFLRADLSVPEEVRQVVADAVRVFGQLDYAFNNAGISGPTRTLAEQSEADFDEVFQINVKSLFIIMQQEIHQMLHQGWGGSIVNMASVGSMLATPGASLYVASKHAVVGLTKSAAIEYGPQGIRVKPTLSTPGPVADSSTTTPPKAHSCCGCATRRRPPVCGRSWRPTGCASTAS
jgi:NAD(P)-dependent dehydrogenase (short-subunit alcohol dehydrogenase family)